MLRRAISEQTRSAGALISRVRVARWLPRTGSVYRPYIGLALLVALIAVPTLAFAQSPWENSANAINNAFTGTIGRALAPVAIIVGGLMWMFGEGGARRHIAALIMGGGMVLAATAFSTWLFGRA